MLPKRHLVVDVVDHSPEGMFGKQRLIGQTFNRNVGFGSRTSIRHSVDV